MANRDCDDDGGGGAAGEGYGVPRKKRRGRGRPSHRAHLRTGYAPVCRAPDHGHRTHRPTTRPCAARSVADAGTARLPRQRSRSQGGKASEWPRLEGQVCWVEGSGWGPTGEGGVPGASTRREVGQVGRAPLPA